MKLKLLMTLMVTGGSVFTVCADTARAVPFRTLSCERFNRAVKLTFSEGLCQRLYFAWGATDGGDTTNAWDHVVRLADVAADETVRVLSLPDDVKFSSDTNHGRFFMQPNVPGVRVVQYIHSTGTDEYVDTGFTPNANSSVTSHFTLESNKDYPVPFGARTGTKNAFFALAEHTYNRWKYYYGSSSSGSAFTQNTPKVYDEHEYTLDGKGRKVTISTHGILNSRDLSKSLSFTCDRTLYAFAAHNTSGASNFAAMKLYSMAVWDAGTLVRDYVPALDGNDTPCLYDIQNSSYVYGAGETPLTAGDEWWATADVNAVTERLTVARSLSAGRISSQGEVTVSFSHPGLAQRLFLAWSETVNGGETTNAWPHVQALDDVGEFEESRVVTLPADAKDARLFMCPIVPGGRVIQYVHSTGTDEYVDTGFTPNANSCVTSHFTLESNKDYPAPFGARTGTKNVFFALAENTYNRWKHYYGPSTSGIAFAQNTPKVYDEHEYTLDGKGRKVTISTHGVLNSRYLSSSLSFTCDRTLYAFAAHNTSGASNFAAMKLYSMAVWDAGTLVRDYVPVYDEVNGRPALYDLVNGEFVFGQGTTSFTAGETAWRMTLGSLPIVSAVWTRAAGTDDRTNPNNWADCVDYRDETIVGTVPTSTTALTLAADASWDSVADYTATIDLAGRKLTIGDLSGSVSITNAIDSLAELHVVVQAGQTNMNHGVALSGNLKLVKEGMGTLVTSRPAQTYSGGTSVVAGTLRAGAVSVLGAADSTVTVETDATFDMAGWLGYDIYAFVLNGGTFANTTSVRDGTYKSPGQLSRLTLTADSFLNAQGSCGLVNTDNAASTISLGGHTLFVDIGSDQTFALVNTEVKEGTIDIRTGGSFTVDVTASDASSSKLIVRDAALSVLSPLTVGEYESSSNTDLGYGTAQLNVLSRFTPMADYFYGCTLQTGATLDLSTRDFPWSLTSSLTQGSNTVSFADNATIVVDFGNRVIPVETRIVAWEADTKPANLDSLKFQLPNGEHLRKREDGLYLTRGFMLILR